METYSTNPLRIAITGAGGFIASHLAKRLKSEGHYIIAADWKQNQYFKTHEFCDEFHLLDLRYEQSANKITQNVDHVFHLAADMGGMGFIQSNHAIIQYNNTIMSLNMLEAARQNNVKRFFFASSACVYPEYRQTNAKITPLKEEEAWPAQPQDAYGLEKLFTEELAMNYQRDFGLEVRIGRYHNVYGPYGTWHGGREKAPAAFARKVITNSILSPQEPIEIWGGGEQTRSFIYIDDAVEGTLRLMKSDYNKPVNIGTTELISMNDLVDLIAQLTNYPQEHMPPQKLHIQGPVGVVGRNSDNTLIKQQLNGWEPSIPLKYGLTQLVAWLKPIITNMHQSKQDISQFQSSMIVNKTCTDVPWSNLVNARRVGMPCVHLYAQNK